jgi:hypothetical protein
MSAFLVCQQRGNATRSDRRILTLGRRRSFGVSFEELEMEFDRSVIMIRGADEVGW